MRLPESLELYGYMALEVLSRVKNFFTRRRIEGIAITLLVAAAWTYADLIGLLLVVGLALLAMLFGEMSGEIRRNWKRPERDDR